MRTSGVAILIASLLLLPVRAQQVSTQSGQRPAREPAVKAPPQTLDPQQRKTPDTVDQDDVVRITTNVVQIDAVVTKDGKHVTDLKAEDFEIFEDKKPQKITNFTYVSNVSTDPEFAVTTSSNKDPNRAPVAPVTVRAGDPHRTIAIVVDDLGIAFDNMGSVRKQVRRFIEQDMRPNDLVAIIRTGGEVGALQQFTTDKRLLLRAADNLKWNTCSRMGISVFGQRLAPCEGGYDPLSGTVQALRFILEGMRKMPGRKSMIILSDNVPLDNPDEYFPRAPARPQVPTNNSESESVPIPDQYGNESALKGVAELAIRSSVVIYGSSTTGVQPLGPFPEQINPWEVNLRPTGDQPFLTLSARSHTLQDNSTGLELVARKTGGFAVKYSNNFGLKRFAQDQEGYYLIGYRPATETFNRRFHSIKVRVKRPGLTVRTRSGFFGMTDEEAVPVQYTARDQIANALMSPFGASDIEVNLSAVFANLPQTGSLVRSLIHFPASAVTFTAEPDGGQKATINLSCIVFGDNGSVAEHVSETREVRLRADQFDRVISEGLTYQYDVPIKKAGAYQFRVAVRDAGSARIGTAREFVDVPDMKKKQLVLSGITLSGYVDTSNTAVLSFRQLGNPAIRRFKSGSNVLYGYAIYNAKVEKGANLTTQAKIFRDGKPVYEGPLKPVDLASQKDLGRIEIGGGVQLGSVLEPGEYLLQIVVNDPLAKEKNRTASRWIDFEIVK